MKTIKKSTVMPLFITVAAIIFLFGLQGFDSKKEGPAYESFMKVVVFEIETTDHTQSPSATEDMQVMVGGRNVKIDVLPDARTGRGKFIFNGNKGKNGEMVLVDDDKKEYYVVDDAFIESMVGTIDKSKNMMEEAMKGLTKEQRDMIAKAQKQSGNKMPGMKTNLPTPVITNTGERATKAGYPCVKYEITLNGRKIREAWTTDWRNIDGGNEVRDAFKGMHVFTEKIKDKIGKMLGGNSPYQEMNLENGFPVVTSSFNERDGSLEDESWLRKTRRQTIDLDAFEPPAGYKRMSMGPR